MKRETKNKTLQDVYLRYLDKAMKHLEYSLKKSLPLSKKLEDNTDETLEVWESLTARFARVVDSFSTKYIKLQVKESDPGFDGTLRDYLNVAEKMKLISDVDRWISLRELRHIQAHDYTEDAFQRFVTAIQTESSFVLEQLKGLKSGAIN